MAWKPLLASLGGEVGLILTLDPANPISIPAGRGGTMEMPAPGLLLALKVKSDFLYDNISAKMQANPKTAASEEGGLKICSMPLEVPIPIALSPTVASSGDYFFFATSPDVVRAVQAVRQGKRPGLNKAAEFQELAKHLPAQGNQFVYVSESFGKTVSE